MRLWQSGTRGNHFKPKFRDGNHPFQSIEGSLEITITTTTMFVKHVGVGCFKAQGLDLMYM